METETKKALVCGAGGFIGSHMVKKLKSEGYWVRGADKKYPEFSMSEADEFLRGDLTGQTFCDMVCNCLLYTSPSPRDKRQSRMPSSA